MFKVLKNLKESWISVIIIILLLVLQATADLALPDYTSKIVNVGIQQGGIENSCPEVLRKTTMDDILMFSEDDENILSRYTLRSKNSLAENEYSKYLKEYPAIEKEELYILNDKLTGEQKEVLSNQMAKPLMIISSLKSGETADKIKISILANLPKELHDKYKEYNALELIREVMKINYNMPNVPANNEQTKSPLAQMLEESKKQIDQMPDTIIEQAAIQAIKEEYKAVGINTDEYQYNYILLSGLQMLGVAFISMAMGITIMALSARVAAKLGRTLRNKIFKKVLGFSTSEFKEFSTASLITRSTNDIQQIQMLVGMMFRVIVYAPIMGIGGFVKVMTQSENSMAWIIGLAIGSIIFIMTLLFTIAMPKFKKLQELIDRLNQVAREMLTGIPVIRAFHTEKREEARFDEANTNLTKNYKFVNNAMNLMLPFLSLIMNGISLLIIWAGAQNVDLGVMQVGDIMAFLQYSMHIIMSFLFFSMISIALPRASISAKRIYEVLDKENSIKDPKEPKQFNESKKGLVEFKNVSFKYPDADEELLNNITFTAEPGKTTAIIGSTGSGKSTIVNLIPRLYDVTEGELDIDGVNIKDVLQKDLRDKIGFVPQKGVLFSGTIESNIKYSDENMSDEQMTLAAEIAQATEFIEQKENKYNSDIAQGGSNVSGGQKQRLSIARAIAKDPEIFVFDDSFSALDYKTDAKLREALKKKKENKTVIIVAQRINTILHADQIIVLDEGKIVGIGTHKQLMENCEVYRQIALSQLSEKELEE